MIATGGSVVYGREAMEHYKEIGTIVYLKQDYERIAKRLRDIRGRGVVLRENQTLEELYDERQGLYEKYADIIIDEKSMNVEETIEKLVELLKAYKK